MLNLGMQWENYTDKKKRYRRIKKTTHLFTSNFIHAEFCKLFGQTKRNQNVFYFHGYDVKIGFVNA